MLPDLPDILQRVSRGRRLVIALNEATDMTTAMATARTLNTQLPSDMHAITSSRGPSITVLQLITDAEATTLLPALDRLIGEFRHTTNGLVSALGADDLETVQFLDATWSVSPHGEHCRFEDLSTGQIVEANIYVPEDLDPYFLLLFAKTSGRHGAIFDACTEGFNDMCRLLEFAGKW